MKIPGWMRRFLISLRVELNSLLGLRTFFLIACNLFARAFVYVLLRPIVQPLLRLIRIVVVLDGFWWIAGIAAVLVTGISLSLYFWDELANDNESLSSTIRNVGLLIGGIIAILLAVWRSRVAERQANTAQQRLLNERYERGAEMLGNEVFSVRLGGIYALKRLADEHPEEYHIQVMELLCAFARNPAGRDVDEKRDRLAQAGQMQIGPLRGDVQVILTTIGNRSKEGIALERKARTFQLDLQNADLSRANLPRANFAHVNLSGADLSGADLTNAHLSGAQIRSADLSGVTAQGVDLSRAACAGANLSHADLQRADLSNANLATSDLSHAKLRSAKLTGVFFGARRVITDLDFPISEGDLLQAAYVGANLSHADLQKADLTYAQIAASDLSHAKLRSVNLSGVIFGSCEVIMDSDSPISEGVFARLTQRQLDEAIASYDNPPTIAIGAIDIETGKQLAWRGKPCQS